MNDARGLYLGVALGYGILSLLYLRLLLNINWTDVLEDARKRSEKSSSNVKDENVNENQNDDAVADGEERNNNNSGA